MNDSLYIGLLSGSSMDAIDVALVSFKDQTPKLIKTLNYPFPASFRSRCLEICQSGYASIDDYGKLDSLAGEIFAEAVLTLLHSTHYKPSQIRAIGSHGQNLRHSPNSTPPFSLQVGDPNIITERTQILTIADFRRRDIAAGGQGAPLAPSFHASVFQSQAEDRVIINIGGITNFTILYANPDQPILGFDAGPGNCLMDLWAHKHWNVPFDKDGEIASRGTVIPDLLLALLTDPFFTRQPPKSTGREYFNERWLAQYLSPFSDCKNEDILATLLALTAEALTQAILTHANAPTASVYICGGGAHNPQLMAQLGKALNRSINTTDALGFPPDWIEAILFAWLAKQTLEGKAGNCPNVTGAQHSIPLGGIFGFHPRYSF